MHLNLALFLSGRTFYKILLAEGVKGSMREFSTCCAERRLFICKLEIIYIAVGTAT